MNRYSFVLAREKLKGVTLPIEEPVEYDVAEAGEAEETVRVIATAFSTADFLAVARVGSDREQSARTTSLALSAS